MASGGGSGPVRRASHAGSWYSDNAKELNRQLTTWLSQADDAIAPARAIIAPHAGYTFCGETAAYAYKQVVPDRIERVFVLGPSHVVCLSGCAVTTCSRYRTPLYDLNVDQKITAELRDTGAFELMEPKSEEAEHSIEMQLPYIAKVMESRRPDSWTIVPVLVGSLSSAKQAQYGKLFAKYLADPHNLFVISSDFCHWGHRFHFSPHEASSGLEIYQQIESLDREGMNAIERLEPQVFSDYLKRTQNTICGRHPICVMLQAAEHFRQMNNHWGEVRFLHYSQSNQCRHTSDSSVSYAAAALFIKPK
uniref:Protein MEMO1 n=1 Tax=Plectus sambesii TaxID=2011161 RepID=A0A914VQV5_9BILA